MSNSNILYHATPLEQVHSLYLAQQIFGVQSPNSVCISGRNAVPFLTQSNIDRSILRSIWSVADPHNFGSLTSMQQFWVVLRLVAMVQAGLLQSNSNNLVMALQQHASQPLNLPFFSNVVIPPSNQLMQMYGHLVIQQQSQQPQQPQQQSYSQSQPQTNNAIPSIPTPSTPSRNVSTNSNSTFQSVGDAFGSLVEVEDVPLTPLRDMSMPQYNASPVTAASASVGDAFSGMGEATNAPLPALGGTTPSGSTSLRPSVSTTSVPSTPNPTVLYTTPTSTRAPAVARTPGGSSTGGFGFWSLGASSVADRAKTIATSTPTPKQPLPTSILSTVSDDDDDDNFGDFGSANPPPPIPSMPPTDTAKTNIQSSFANTSNEATNVASSPPKQNRFSFYAPDVGEALAAENISNTAPVVSVSDAFGDMLPVADAPLPSLDAFGNTTANQETTMPSDTNDDGGFGEFEAAATTNDVESEEEDDDFGNFEQAAPTDNAAGDKDLFGFSDNTPQQESSLGRAPTEQSALSISDAFGDMPMQQDAPLPSLGDFAAPTSAPTLPDDDDDDFGDFEDAPAQPTSAIVSESNDLDEDGFGDFGGVPATTEAKPESAQQPVSIMDAFGDMPAQPDAPLPSLGGFGASNIETVASDDNDDDDFGDFEDAAPTTTVEAESTIMDAFGDMPAQADAPLPSLGAFGTSNTEAQAQEDDDFGDFADAAPLESEPAPLVRSVSIDDAFGDFAAPEDAPLPSLEQFGATSTTVDSAMPAEQEESDDDFGDFSGTAPPSEPLPSENDENDEDDEFGDFDQAESTVEEPSEAPAVPTAPLPSISDDPFADMPTNDAPLPSLAVLSNTNQPAESQSPEREDSDDEFGGFESSAVDNTVPVSDTNLMDFGAPSTTDQPSDVFGDFGVADAPLPSLPNPTASGTTQEPDLFGDFAASGQNQSTLEQTPPNDGAGDLLDIFGTQTPITTQKNAVDEDELGDFGAAESKPETATTGDEGFGAFGTADAINDAPAQQNVQEDIFGDFGNAPVKPSTDDDDDFGAFGGAPAQVAPSAQEDDFGDFGSTPVVDSTVEDQAEDQDDFGDFGSAEPPAPIEATIQPVNDDFGVFGSAQVQETTDENDFGDFGSAAPAAPSDDKDDFGDFGSAPMSQDDDFGDFGSANPTTPIQTEEENDFGDFDSANIVPEPQVEDDFGDFGSAELATSTDQNVNDFGAFSSSPAEEPAKDAPNSDEDLFGAFGSAEVTHEQPASSTESVQQFGEAPVPVDDDDFGAFGSAEFSSPPEVEQTSATSTAEVEDDSDFGDFTVVDAPQTTKPETEDNFGDFSGVQDSSPPVVQSQQDNGDDWGDFEAVSASPPRDAMGELRDRIRSLALQLPDCVLRKAGVSGDHVDLGEAFEIMVETNSAVNEKRAQRCIQVLESLTSSQNSKLASTVWMQIFDVVIEELELAKSLLAEASISFSNNWNEIKTPLATMVQGLAEYMRVARSIVASIGDMLLVDESAMLTVDTWASTWSSLSLLEKALRCETKWKEVNQLVKNTPIGAVPTPTLQEIRSEASKLDSAPVLCHLTLQPLHKKLNNTTKAEVSFQGKCFMACSANFLANRCPSLI